MSAISPDVAAAAAAEDSLAAATPEPAAGPSLQRRPLRRRGWLTRRALVLADVVGLTAAFALSMLLFSSPGGDDVVSGGLEVLVFGLMLPVWVVAAHLNGLYERDGERADYSTVDDVLGVVHLVTLGTWLVFIVAWATGVVDPGVFRLVTFWAGAIALVIAARAVARWRCRASSTYVQRALIVGAGNVGQLVARKLRQHPEYGIRLVGFVDEQPKQQRADLGSVPVLGTADRLHELVREHDADRIIVAFSREPDARTMALIRSLNEHDVQVDVVPRLFELVGPRATVHTIEGLALLNLPPGSLTRLSFALKRVLDVVLAGVLLVLTSPLFVYAALRVRLDSPGPVLYRQRRLGLDMREFTALKFRTMRVGTDESVHRDYVRGIMSSGAELGSTGLYKLQREDAVTPFGSWLRRTSLDELPQLVNVLRGDMSLVGPRPCIPYETENFQPHHFERFLVPQGMTGLWQVTARAHSTFGEALDMDVAYVRGWSLGLDLRLLLRTPFSLLRQRKATA